jgi:homoserine O-succinyltransferase
VLHLDQIERVALPEKCIGVFDCDKLADHPLTLNLPSRAAVPHARWNGLSEDALVAAGYQVLTRSPGAGVDAFMREDLTQPRKSLFLFFQGHPEYGALSLLNEFRREVGRFLKRERDRYPAMPQRYLDAPIEAALAAFRARAEREPREELLAEFPVPADPGLDANWQPFAVTVYRNWLSTLSAQKQRLQRPAQYMAALRLDQAPAPAV